MGAGRKREEKAGAVAELVEILPRLIRMRDAPKYLAMDRSVFNAEVRPFVVELRIGRQGIAFDRLQLDAWVEGRVSAGQERRNATTRSPAHKTHAQPTFPAGYSNAAFDEALARINKQDKVKRKRRSDRNSIS